MNITYRHAFATLSFVAEIFIFLYVGMDALDIEKWRFVSDRYAILQRILYFIFSPCFTKLPPKNYLILSLIFHLQSWNISGCEFNTASIGYGRKSSFCFPPFFLIQFS